MTSRNLVLAAAVSDLAALLDYTGRHREASSLRGEIAALARVRGVEALTHVNRIRGGISALRHSPFPAEARVAADDVVARIQRVLA